MIHKTAKIHPTAIIYPNVQVGEDTVIGPYCIIGAPAEHRSHYPDAGKGVIIGSDCVLHGHCTVDSGIEYPTLICAGTWVMKGAHIGHDTTIFNDCTISDHALVGGHAQLGHHVNLGLGCAIHQHIAIPNGVMIGMNSTVTKTSQLKPFHKYAGSPVRELGYNTVLAKKLGL